MRLAPVVVDDFDLPTKPEWLTLSLQRRGPELQLVDEPCMAAKLTAFIVAGAIAGAAVGAALVAILHGLGR